jgi:membrane protein DedA with SNARE-associated domain
VLDPSHLFQHLGYAAILVVVLLGNAGVPAPEESVLILGGYLAWQGRLDLRLVILVGIFSASLGDNLGFWAGRRYGQRAIARLPLPQARLAQAQTLITRYGARAVFVSRFVAGFRTVAGPLAGAGGLPPLRFFTANLLGAVCYVPWPVLAGYGAGYGLGDWFEKLREKFGLKEDLVLFAAIVVVAGAAFLVMTWSRERRAARQAAS